MKKSINPTKNDTEVIEEIEEIDETDGISFEDIEESVEDIDWTEDLETQEIIQTNSVEYEAKKMWLELHGQKQFLDMQQTWAGNIKRMVWAVLIFQFLFVILIGFNIQGFTDNLQKLAYMYIVIILQSLTDIIALGLVVTKFLFPKITTSSK